MKRYILLSLICLAGCRPSTRPESSELELAARAEWAFASASLGLSIPSGSPRSEAPDFTSDNPSSRAPAVDDSQPPDETAGDSTSPVVKAYAPEWCAPAADFRSWYSTVNPSIWDVMGFKIELVPDDEIPESIGEVPAFELNGQIVVGWEGIETLKGQLVSNPYTFEGRRDRREKRDHGVPMGAVNQSDIFPLVVGDGISLERSGPEISIPLGYRASLIVPAGMRVNAVQDGGETVVEIISGNPTVKLPLIGKLWPIRVEGFRLSDGMLTVELDGWKDYQIRVLP